MILPFVINPDFNFKGDSVSSVCTANSSTNVDFKVTGSSMYTTGGILMVSSAVLGDYFKAQVIDKDNVLGYGSNVVLSEFITKWYMDPSGRRINLDLPYAAQVPQNTYIRIVYTSTGNEDPTVLINFYLHQMD